MGLLPFSPRSIDALKEVPWATFGRRESGSEFAKKWLEQKSRAGFFKVPPKFTIIVAFPEDASSTHLSECVAGLSSQSYLAHEVFFVLASGAVGTAKLLESSIEQSRFQIIRSKKKNPTATELKIEGAAKATGDWLAFLDPSDILSPVALFQCALELQRAPDTDVLYTNEATVDSASRALSAFVTKTEFSPLTLKHFNYLGRFWLMRKSLFDSTGGLDAETQDQAEHDLLLRASERTTHFTLCPLFLCYRRAQSQADVASLSVIQKHLLRTKWDAEVSQNKCAIRIVPKIADPNKSKVSVMIPFRNRSEWTLRAAKQIEAQKGRVGLEIILIDNESDRAERVRVEEMLPTFSVPIRIVDYAGPFNFGRMHNEAVQKYVTGDLLLFLNNDVFLEGNNQLDAWAGWALLPSVGTVGIQLRYGHGAVQHAGIRAFFGGEARLVRVGNAQNEDRFTVESHEVFANTFAACLVRREVYDAAGRLPELDMANGFGDVAFNFECRRKGLHNMYLGHIRGQHLESASRGPAYEYWEECELERRYPDLLQKMLRYDLAYNRVPGLDNSIPDFLRQTLKVKFREHTPWLDPIKPGLKKILRTFLEPKDNSTA